jgi:hypothetical protein
MNEPFVVILECDAGTSQLVGSCRERVYHTITWGAYSTMAEAHRIRAECAINPTVRRAWIEARKVQFEGGGGGTA